MEDYIPIWLEAKTTREFWMASPEPEEVRVNFDEILNILWVAKQNPEGVQEPDGFGL